MLRLINSGKSNLSKIQDKIVKETFDVAYELMEYFYTKGRKKDVKLVYKNVMEIVPNAEMKPFMKYPEMYENMVAFKQEFIQKTAFMISKANTLSVYMQNKNRSK